MTLVEFYILFSLSHFIPFCCLLLNYFVLAEHRLWQMMQNV